MSWASRIALVVVVLWSTSEARSEPTRMDWALAEVKADLTRSLNCVWDADPYPPPIVCPLQLMNLGLFPDGDGSVESVELTLVNETASPRDRNVERASRETAIDTVRYFLPMWRGGGAWLSKALRDAVRPHTKRVTRVGRITVMVHWVQPNRPDTYAVVVLTKRSSLEKFEYGLN